MTEERAKRKLAGILSADVKGYSRLMGDDDLATVRTLEAYRARMAEVIQKFRGRIVDSPGDNVLAEFASVVDAVESAVEMQKELKDKNAELPENRRMEFRMGINLGDVIVEGERIYGDGVNIAARIEGLATPGEICISSNVHEQVKNKLNLDYEYLGKHAAKNIAEPIEVYQIIMEPDVHVVNMPKAIKLPGRPSIAVLPFENMSGDSDQGYFSDGVTEEIITGLSKVPNLFVIARNSSFTYKGKPVKVQQVGQELGVRYVLEGSVRKAGDRVRITAQLIDAKTGHHLWAERYERELKDIFALQDEITINIMRAMQLKLTEGEQACEWLKRGSENFEAYEKGMKGMEFFRRFSPEGNVRARQMFEEAITLDPQSEGNYVMLAWTYLLDLLNGWAGSPERSMERAIELAGKALTLDELQADAHSLLGYIYLLKREYEKAIGEGKRAVSLNPNGADAHVWLAMILTSAGRASEAIGLLNKAMRLNPLPPNWYYLSIGDAYLWTGRYEEAVEEYCKALQGSPDFLLVLLGLTAAYWLLGRKKEASKTAEEIVSLDPEFSLQHLEQTMPFKNRDDLELMIQNLREAGLK
jgi:adenylate cyclase